MTVKELKEKLECLIEDGNEDFIVLNDSLYELDESNIIINKENKEVWIKCLMKDLQCLLFYQGK